MVLGNVRVHHAAEVVVDQRPCARAASGQAAAEPATTLMKSRRRTQPSPAKSRTTPVFEAYQIKAAMFALGHKRTFALKSSCPLYPRKRTLAEFTFSANDIALRSYRTSRLIVPLLKQPCAYLRL